jgi:hypothetical protein
VLCQLCQLGRGERLERRGVLRPTRFHHAPTYAINAVFFENYWNDGSPREQERYFDDIVISTAPVGCL